MRCQLPPKCWTKPCAVRSEKTVIGWIFKKSLGRPALGPTERKMGILPTRSITQVQTHSVYLQDPRIFQTDLGSLDPSYREKLNKPGVFYLFFPVIMQSFPTTTPVRGNCYLKMKSKQGFSSSGLLSAPRMLENIYFFDE